MDDWNLTESWRQRWDEWIKPGGHGGLADVRNDSLAWCPPKKPLEQCTVALLTTGGLHLKSQKPFELQKKGGDWSWRAIPSSMSAGELAISHTHYGHLD